MLEHARRNAVAYLALFVALSGTSYAATGGIPGGHGPRGPKDEPGSIEAVMSAFGGAAPSPTPDVDLLVTTLTTKTSGRLLVLARGRYREDCAATSQVQLGVYVDGAGVPGSGFPVAPGSGGAELSVWGLTAASVPAGEHNVVVAGDCLGSDSVGGSAGGDAAVGAIVLGR